MAMRKHVVISSHRGGECGRMCDPSGHAKHGNKMESSSMTVHDFFLGG